MRRAPLSVMIATSGLPARSSARERIGHEASASTASGSSRASQNGGSSASTASGSRSGVSVLALELPVKGRSEPIATSATSGCRRNASSSARHECVSLFRRVARSRQRQPGCGHSIGVESNPYVRSVAAGSAHQAAGRQQRHGERHFADDEQLLRGGTPQAAETS